MNAPTVKTYSLDELKSLYRNANERMKMFILLGLNCGFCSMEMATLKHSEIDLKAKVIQRKRQKNGNPMSWKLWTETATALARNTSESEGELALTTTGGKPLVWYSGNGHSSPWF
jgi:integrase